MAEMKKMKTAVVGCGSISNIYCKNLKNMYAVIDLVALVDIFPEAAKRRAEQFGIEKTMTMEELCADPEIELVVNLTGPAQHYDVIKQLLNAGKNVYTEKTLASNLEQAKELAALAEEKGVYLGCAPDTFLGAPVQTAIHYMDKGMIGEVQSFNVSVNRNHQMGSELARMLRGEGGAFPFDVGPYYLNALIAMFGPVEKVTGFARAARPHKGRIYGAGNYGEEWTMKGNNMQAGVLKFKSGVIGTILFEGDGCKDETPTFVINGTDGILMPGDTNHFASRVQLIQNGETVTLPNTHGFSGTPIFGDPMPDWDWGGDRGAGVAEMAYSIQQNRLQRASKEMAVHVMEILYGIDQSSATGETYTLQTTCERPRPLPAGYNTVTGAGLSAEASLEQ